MDFSFITNNYLVLGIGALVVAALFIGYKYGSTIKKQFPKFLSRYAICIALGIFILGLCVTDDSLQQGMFTFSSVYFAFWLGNLQNTLNERRLERFYLGPIWNELRINTHILKNLMLNYTFYLEDFGALPYVIVRFNSVSKHLTHLKNSACLSSLNSAAITSVSSDDIFNNVEIAYNDIVYLKSFFGVLDTDFSNKATLLEKNLVTQEPLKHTMQEDMRGKILAGAEEIAIALSTSKRAQAQLATYLDKVGIKVSEEELRKDKLGPSEQDFIAKVLRTKPLEPTSNNVGHL